jgi:AAHS family 4-hydroxybenzoate transporter-like MFS transporter
VNGLIAKLFPTAMRATGISSALGIGRFGTIAGPAIGGAMLSLGLPVQTVFLIATIPTLFTTTSIILLWLRGRRPRPPSGVAATGLEHA